MSDINTYADEAAITALSPINGDLVLNQADSSLYLCINADAAGINRWKKFANDAALALYQNRWGASLDRSSYLQCGNITALNSVANASFSFWYKTSEASNAMVTLIGDSSNGLAAYQYSDGSMYIHSFMGSPAHSISNPTSGVWHHIACTFEASASKAYLDGSLVSTVDHGDVTTSICGNNFSIGILPGYSNTLDGTKLVDEVALFTSTLSAADITKIYNGGIPRSLTSASSYDTDRTANLKGYWRMGDDSNDSPSSDPTSNSIATITDSSGSGNDATQTDTTKQPTFADLTNETIYS